MVSNHFVPQFSKFSILEAEKSIWGYWEPLELTGEKQNVHLKRNGDEFES